MTSLPDDLTPLPDDLLVYTAVDSSARIVVRPAYNTCRPLRLLTDELVTHAVRPFNEPPQRITHQQDPDPVATIRKFRIVGSRGDCSLSQLIDYDFAHALHLQQRRDAVTSALQEPRAEAKRCRPTHLPVSARCRRDAPASVPGRQHCAATLTCSQLPAQRRRPNRIWRYLATPRRRLFCDRPTSNYSEIPNSSNPAKSLGSASR